MSKKMLDQLLDGAGDELLISAAIVVEKESGQSIDAKVAAVANDLAALQSTLETFLSGAADGGDVDRLKELVASIAANRDSIDAIMDGSLKEEDLYDGLDSDDAGKALTAKQGRILHEALGALGGVAIVSSLEETPVFDGRITMLLTDYGDA